MKKLFAWIIRNRKVFIYILLIILSAFLFYSLWKTVWEKHFANDYIWDLSISISDLIQILVILTALFGPLLVDYMKRKIQRPIIRVMFFDDTRNVFIDYKKKFAAGKIVSFDSEKCWHYSLMVKNVGKTKLNDCEAVLSKIFKVENENYVSEFLVPQLNLKWLDFFRTNYIDINPEREYRLAILFFPEVVRAKTTSDIKFRIYESKDDYHSMIDLPLGVYYFNINFYSNNAEIRPVILKFTFSAGEQIKDNQWKPNASMDSWALEKYSPFSKLEKDIEES